MTDVAGDLYRQVIDGTSYAVIVADEQGVIRVWDGAAQALLGYTAAEAVGHSVELVIPDSLRAAHRACYARAVGGGQGYSRADEASVPARCRDGSTIQIRGNITVLQDSSRRVTGAALIVRLADEPAYHDTA